MAFADSLLAPLAGSDPTGEDLSFDIVYDEIREARKRALDPRNASAAAEWKTVAKVASEVLNQRSKDLQVGAWLTEAWFKTQGLPGMLDGLMLSHQLMERFWDGVHPRPEGGDLGLRATPLNWIDSELADSVGLHPFFPEGLSQARIDLSRELWMKNRDDAKTAESLRKDGLLSPDEISELLKRTGTEWFAKLSDELTPILEEVGRLRSTCDTRFEALSSDDRPTFTRLREQLGAVNHTVLRYGPEQRAPGDEVEGASDVDGPEKVGGGARLTRPTSPGSASESVVQAAAFLRGTDATDPTPYMVVRALRWGQVRIAGPDIDPLLLEAPAMETRIRLQGLLAQQEWEELLRAAESVAASEAGRGWLDVHRFVLTAFRGLGEEYDRAARAVRRLLGGFLADHPGLVTMVLTDGSATANPQTLAWLRAEGIHDTAPVIRDLLARIENASLDDFAVGATEPTAVRPSPTTPEAGPDDGKASAAPEDEPGAEQVAETSVDDG